MVQYSVYCLQLKLEKMPLNLVEQSKIFYYEIFNRHPQVISYAPGRVNLIGEHIDYNNGFVLPIAIPLITVIVGEKTDSDTACLISLNMDEPNSNITLNMKELLFRKHDVKWVNYLLGILEAASKISTVPAFNLLIYSNIPIGAGLSSSAALEVAFFKFLAQLCPEMNTLSPLESIVICQQSEKHYADVPCGIMDQYVSFEAKKDNALFLDCRSLSAEQVPFFNTDVSILVIDSKIKHNLAQGEYSNRRDQCLEGAQLLKKASLRDVSINDLKDSQHLFGDEVILKRVTHVVTEMCRTKQAAVALESRDFVTFGKLMTESHRSLRDDYEVSCSEIDNIVDTTLTLDGVYGSRITGGGFGGCTVSLIQTKRLNDIINELETLIKSKVDFYNFQPSNGAGIVAI